MTRGLFVILLLLWIYSCGGGGDVAVTQTGNPSQVSLYTQVGTKKTQNLTVTAKRSAREDEDEEDISSVTITSARIVVEKVSLVGDDGVELTFHNDSPYVINVALDSSKQLIDSIVDTSGHEYHSASLFLTPLTKDEAHISDTALVGHSIVINGFVNNDSSRVFSFESDSVHLLNIPFEMPFVVNNKGTSVLFITLDVGTWFQDDDGDILDPFDDDFKEDIEKEILKGIYGSEEDEDDWDDDDDDEDEEDNDNDEDE